jgi:hypothetical protein
MNMQTRLKQKHSMEKKNSPKRFTAKQPTRKHENTERPTNPNPK